MQSSSTRYRYSLVELYVDLFDRSYGDLAEAIQDVILSDPQRRAEDVRQVLDRLDEVDCERVLFPGWTLVGQTFPQWLLDRTGSRTIVIEMLPGRCNGKANRHKRPRERPDGMGWHAYVARDGRVIVGPVLQLFWNGEGAGKPGSPSLEAETLVAQLAGRAEPDRRWRDPCWPQSGLILCGEVNVIYVPDDIAQFGPVVAGFPCFDLLMNPAHKPNCLPRMTAKRLYLSQLRPHTLLLTTANIHGRWLRNDGRVGRSRSTAAEVYCNSRAQKPSRTLAVGRHRILLFE